MRAYLPLSFLVNFFLSQSLPLECYCHRMLKQQQQLKDEREMHNRNRIGWQNAKRTDDTHTHFYTHQKQMNPKSKIKV